MFSQIKRLAVGLEALTAELKGLSGTLKREVIVKGAEYDSIVDRLTALELGVSKALAEAEAELLKAQAERRQARSAEERTRAAERRIAESDVAGDEGNDDREAGYAPGEFQGLDGASGPQEGMPALRPAVGRNGAKQEQRAAAIAAKYGR